MSSSCKNTDDGKWRLYQTFQFRYILGLQGFHIVDKIFFNLITVNIAGNEKLVYHEQNCLLLDVGTIFVLHLFKSQKFFSLFPDVKLVNPRMGLP